MLTLHERPLGQELKRRHTCASCGGSATPLPCKPVRRANVVPKPAQRFAFAPRYRFITCEARGNSNRSCWLVLWVFPAVAVFEPRACDRYAAADIKAEANPAVA